jgi:putative tricarboxylic transport membrane protein
MHHSRSDRVFGLLSLALAALMAWGTDQIQESFIQDPLGPKAFPWLIAGVLGLSGLVMVIKPDPHQGWPTRHKLVELASSVAVMLGYAYWLPEVGFVVSTALCAAFLSWRLGSTWRQSVVAGCVLSLGIYVVFQWVLGLTLARGPWGF